jgi:hypothetical protein
MRSLYRDLRLAFFIPMLTLVGCKRGAATDTTLDAGAVGAGTVDARAVDAGVGVARPKWPSDAPPSNGGCSKHEECAMIVWDGPSPPDPCCDARIGYLPVLSSYLEWNERYRKANCAGVSCPRAPYPGAEPIQCARVARCVGGRCVDGCKDPSYSKDAPPNL